MQLKFGMPCNCIGSGGAHAARQVGFPKQDPGKLAMALTKLGFWFGHAMQCM